MKKLLFLLLLLTVSISCVFADTTTRKVATVHGNAVYTWESWYGGMELVHVPNALFTNGMTDDEICEALSALSDIPNNTELVALLSTSLVVYKLHGAYYMRYYYYRQGSVDYIGMELPDELSKLVGEH